MLSSSSLENIRSPYRNFLTWASNSFSTSRPFMEKNARSCITIFFYLLAEDGGLAAIYLGTNINTDTGKYNQRKIDGNQLRHSNRFGNDCFGGQ